MWYAQHDTYDSSALQPATLSNTHRVLEEENMPLCVVSTSDPRLELCTLELSTFQAILFNIVPSNPASDSNKNLTRLL